MSAPELFIADDVERDPWVVREEWGVVHLNGWIDGPHAERDARSIAEAWEDKLTPVRRTVITGAWEEER